MFVFETINEFTTLLVTKRLHYVYSECLAEWCKLSLMERKVESIIFTYLKKNEKLNHRMM